MKKAEAKKLVLNKELVEQLDQTQMNHLRGGGYCPAHGDGDSHSNDADIPTCTCDTCRCPTNERPTYGCATYGCVNTRNCEPEESSYYE